MDNTITNSLDILFNKMENFITTKTVVGEPISLEGTVILPLIDVSFGVGAGGGVVSEKEKEDGKIKGATQSNGGGLGAKLTPSAVIVVVDGTVQLINLKNQDGVSKLIDMAPGILAKLNIPNIFEKSKNKKTNKEEDFMEEDFFEEV